MTSLDDFRIRDILKASRCFDLDEVNSALIETGLVQQRAKNMEVRDYDSFLSSRPKGNADLVVHAADHSSFTFRDLHIGYLESACPLLAFSFEDRGNEGRQFLSLNADIELIARFLRYVWTGCYHVLDEQGYELSCTFPMHAQLYQYGDLYALPQLKSMAYCHISQICELGCSMPTAPIGLCETLRYLYENVKEDKVAHETILHYCISRFNAHHLGSDVEFRKLLAEEKECQQDLFRLVSQRGYVDESIPDIMQLPLPDHSRQQSMAFPDYLYHMFGDSAFSTPAQTPLLSPSPAGFTVVHRPRFIGDLPATADSDGYSSDGSLLAEFERFSLDGGGIISSLLHPMTIRDDAKSIHSQDGQDPANPFNDPAFDADESESDWSDFEPSEMPRTEVLGDPRPRQQMYAHKALADSTETVVAVESSEDHASLGMPKEAEAALSQSDSDWELPSDSGLRTAGEG